MKLFHSIVFLIFILLVPDHSWSQSSYKSTIGEDIDQPDEEYVHRLLDSAAALINSTKYQEALTICIEAINLESVLDLGVRARVRLNDDLAGALSGIKAFEYGIKHTKKSIAILKNQGVVNPYDISWRLGRLGTFYLFMDEVDSSLMSFKAALPWAIENGQSLYISSAYNNIGIAFSRINRDSAYFYFDYARKTLTTRKPARTGLLASINDNEADLMRKDSLFRQAGELYHWNYNAFKDHQTGKNRALSAGIQLAEIYFLIDSIKPIPTLLKSLETMLDTSDHVNKRAIIGLWVDFYREAGDEEAELVYVKRELDELDIVKDNSEKSMQVIAHQLNDYGAKRIEKQLELEKLKSSTQKNLLELAEQKAITRLTIIWTSITILLLSMLALYLNYRKKMEERKREQERLDNELALKKRDLEDFAMEINQKQEWTEQLSNKLFEIKNLGKDDTAMAIRSLLNEVRGTQVAEKQKKVFQQNIKEVNHQFFEKLSSNFGDLTKTERELAGLLRMELSNKEIANLRNMEVASVKRGRNRLRKKLNLSPETDIYAFLKSI